MYIKIQWKADINFKTRSPVVWKLYTSYMPPNSLTGWISFIFITRNLVYFCLLALHIFNEHYRAYYSVYSLELLMLYTTKSFRRQSMISLSQGGQEELENSNVRQFTRDHLRKMLKSQNTAKYVYIQQVIPNSFHALWTRWLTKRFIT